MEPKKKNQAEKTPKSKKKWTLGKKSGKKNTKKKYIVLWFELISSIMNNIRKRPA